MRYNVTLPDEFGLTLEKISKEEKVPETELIRRAVQSVYSVEYAEYNLQPDRFKAVNAKHIRGFGTKLDDEILLFIAEPDNHPIPHYWTLEQRTCSIAAANYMLLFDWNGQWCQWSSISTKKPIIPFSSNGPRQIAALQLYDGRILLTSAKFATNTVTNSILTESETSCVITQKELALFFNPS